MQFCDNLSFKAGRRFTFIDNNNSINYTKKKQEEEDIALKIIDERKSLGENDTWKLV